MTDRDALVHLTAGIFAGNEGISADKAVRTAIEALLKIRTTSFNSEGVVVPKNPRSYGSVRTYPSLHPVYKAPVVR